MNETEAEVGRGARSDIVPVVMIDEEKEKALKMGYITLYTKIFRQGLRELYAQDFVCLQVVIHNRLRNTTDQRQKYL